MLRALVLTFAVVAAPVLLAQIAGDRGPAAPPSVDESLPSAPPEVVKLPVLASPEPSPDATAVSAAVSAPPPTPSAGSAPPAPGASVAGVPGPASAPPSAAAVPAGDDTASAQVAAPLPDVSTLVAPAPSQPPAPAPDTAGTAGPPGSAVPGLDLPHIHPFEGGSPHAYAALSRAIEDSIVSFSRSAAESQQRIEQSFGAVGLDFTDPSQRYEARAKLQRDLALLQFYTASIKTLGDAVTAESDFRSRQVSAHINSVRDLGRTRAALAQLSSLAPGSTPDSPYALVSLTPDVVRLTRAAKAHSVTVRSHASAVSVDSATFAVPAGVPPFAVDVSGCAERVLVIGESCVLLVLSPAFAAHETVPSGVMRVGVSSESGDSDLSQQVSVSLAPLEVPPALDDRLAQVEAAAPALDQRNEERMEHLARELVTVIDGRLQAFQDAVDAVHEADESAKRQLVVQAKQAEQAREALSVSFSEEMDRAAEARAALAEGLADVARSLADAERVRLEDREADRLERESLATDVSDLSEQIAAAAYFGQSPGGAGSTEAHAELLGRLADLEGMVLLGPPAATAAPAAFTPSFVDRVHILSLVGDEASLYIEGPSPAAPPVRLTVRPGAPLPYPGWSLSAVLAGEGRIDLSSPSGQIVPVFPSRAPLRPGRPFGRRSRACRGRPALARDPCPDPHHHDDRARRGPWLVARLPPARPPPLPRGSLRVLPQRFRSAPQRPFVGRWLRALARRDPFSG